MKLEFFFKSDIVAGIFMAKLATKFGVQSEMYTLSNGYRVDAEVEKPDVTRINSYADGLKDGMEAK